MLAFEDTELEPFNMDGTLVPLLRLTTSRLPEVEIAVGGQVYHYDRSYLIKGGSAVLYDYVRDQYAAGKKPLILERPDRFYVYLAA